MRLLIETSVSNHFLEVKKGFNATLFKKLSPPFPKVNLLRFDGCSKGDQVQLELNFILFKQRWFSLITFDNTDTERFEFIDEGTVLPFFLKEWKHHHIIEYKGEASCKVIDSIRYKSPFMSVSTAIMATIIPKTANAAWR